METPKIHESEYRFCLIMWEKEPIRSPELVRLCKERLGWKETTAYTVDHAVYSHKLKAHAKADKLVEKSDLQLLKP